MSKPLAAFILLLSSLCFSLATVFAKYAHNACPELSAFQVSFFRFVIGSLFMAVFIRVMKKPIRPNRRSFVIWRGLLNTGAVLTLYVGLRHTTITKANMLNWTFPVFVFLFSPFVNRERPGLGKYFFLGLTMFGMYWVISPDFSSVNLGDLSALASGVLGGAAVSVLRESRKYDDSYVVLFYLMIIGFILNGLLAIPFFIVPPPRVFMLMTVSAICGFLGQITITTASKHFEAASGSILMASGILFAGFLGTLLFGDPVTVKILAGGSLILLSLAGVSGVFRKRG
jgi:drug/metabolite transporter (DMT)-like permease